MIVDINYQAIQQKINQKTDKIILVVSNEFLKDANYFCREDTGETKRSGIRFSLLTEGKIIWKTDYVRKIYYFGSPVKDRNPNASLMWGHKAKDKNMAKYQTIADAIVRSD
jgi:hypothetical protein